MKISIDTSNSSKVVTQIAYAFEVMKCVNEERQKGNSNFVFDFSQSSWFSPFFLAPFASFCGELIENGNKVQIISPVQARVKNYLEKVGFPEGLKPDHLHDWKKKLNSFANKNYLPILNFPTARLKESTSSREQFLGLANEILQKQVGLPEGVKSGVFYIISEMTENIVEHAQCERGWAMAQYYPEKGYLDFCISDNGLSILGSYNRHGYDIANNFVALESALNGKSTKYDGIERGTGLRTSRAILVNGLDGKFCLISGDALFAHSSDIEGYYSLETAWNGTILALRIPNSLNSEFNIYDFFL